MAGIDMPLDQLEAYQPGTYEEDDFDAFWTATLDELSAVDMDVRTEPVAGSLPALNARTVRYRSLGGAEVAGWFVTTSPGRPQPGLCVYHGYGGRAPRPLDLAPYALAGFAVLSVECRGQMGDSPDPVPSRGYVPGWMTQGLMAPETYYYRYVYADAVRAIDVLGQMDGVGGQNIAVAGASQGGGLCLAAAALSGVPRLVFADIPFLCDFPRSLSIVEKRPYSEISDLLRQRPELSPAAYRTLSYFDVLHLARRVRCRTVMTAALWDDVCPPSSIFGTFGQVPAADKRLDILPYHRHEVDYQTVERRLAELATFRDRPLS